MDYTFPHISKDLGEEINRNCMFGKIDFAPWAKRLIREIQRGPDGNEFKFNEEELEAVA